MKTRIRARSDLARTGAVAAVIGLLLLCAVPIVAWVRAGAEPHPVSLWGAVAGRRLVLAAFVPYSAALALFARGRLSRRTVLWLGALMYALVFVPPIIYSHDIVSYLFYGKMAARGHLHPLVAQPAAFSADPWFRYVGWKHAPSVYGPIWTFASAAVGAVTGWRLVPAVYMLK